MIEVSGAVRALCSLGLVSLVEREALLTELRAEADAAARGSGRLVALEGTAGVGKTSLVRTMTDRLPARAGVLWGACEPLSTPGAMKVGGENVAAAEVEGYLLGHPAVLLAQVVAAPDARYTEVPAAFIQLEEGSTVDEEEIIDFGLGNIATLKVPRYVRFVEEWPKSGTRIKKHVLRGRIAEELHTAGITEAPKLTSKQVSSGLGQRRRSPSGGS